MRPRAWLAVPAVLSLAACISRGPNVPQDQRSYVSEWQGLRARWDGTSENAIRQAKVGAAAREFFQAKRPVTSWVGRVSRVGAAFGDTWVDVVQDGVTFMLRPVKGSGLDGTLEVLNQDDPVEFDGTLSGELSLTMTGALRRPVVSVAVTRLRRLK